MIFDSLAARVISMELTCVKVPKIHPKILTGHIEGFFHDITSLERDVNAYFMILS